MNKKTMAIVAASAVVVVLALVLASGGSKEPAAPATEAAPQAAAGDPVVNRMQDPVYLAKLDEQAKGQKSAVKAVHLAKRAYEEAKAAGAGEEELAKLQKAVDAAYQQLDANHKKSQQIVAEQLRKQASR